MAIYKGKIERERLKGEITEIPGVKARISKQKSISAEVSQKPTCKARWSGGIFFSGVATVLDFMIRFLAAKDRIIQTHKAKAVSAPVVDVQADSTFQSGKEAPLSAHPVKEISADRKERLSVYAHLVAYRRAVCRYIKQLFFKSTAKLQAAHGAVAKHSKAVKLKLTSKAIAAESALIDSQNKVQTGVGAGGSSAPIQPVPVESTFSTEHTATASMAAVMPVNTDSAFKVTSSVKMESTAAVVDMNIDPVCNVTHSAPLATWIYPEVIGGILILRQVYSANLEDGILAVR